MDYLIEHREPHIILKTHGFTHVHSHIVNRITISLTLPWGTPFQAHCPGKMISRVCPPPPQHALLCVIRFYMWTHCGSVVSRTLSGVTSFSKAGYRAVRVP